jgi:hypothetical protein
MSREKDWGRTGQTGLPAYGRVLRDVQRLDFYTASWSSTISANTLNEFDWVKRDTRQAHSLDKGCCWQGKNEDDSTTGQEGAGQHAQHRWIHDGDASRHGTRQYAVRCGITGNPSVRSTCRHVEFHKGRAFVPNRCEADFSSSHQANRRSTNHRPLANLRVSAGSRPNITATNFRGLSSNDISTAQNLRQPCRIGFECHRTVLREQSRCQGVADYRKTILSGGPA